MESKLQIAARRWIEVILLALLGTAISLAIYKLVCHPVLSSLFEVLAQPIDTPLITPDWFVRVVSMILLVVVCVFMYCNGGLPSSWGGLGWWLKNLISYPPAIMACFWGYLIIVLIFSFFGVSLEPWGIGLGFAALPVAVLGGPVWHKLFGVSDGPLKAKNEAKEGKPKEGEPSNSIINFVQSTDGDKPVVDPENDALDHTPIADKIVDALVEEKHQAVALIGEYGSGKSTIINFCEVFAREKDRGFLFCRVNPWGMASPETVLEHILDEAIDSVSRRADVLAYRGFPDDYRQAIQATGTKLFGLPIEISRPKQPRKLLQCLNRILVGSSTRLVLCLEDLDRNHFKDSQDLQVVEGLIDLIRSCKAKNIQIIIAIADGRKVDLTKLCETVAYIPRIDFETTGEIVSAFDKSIRDHYPDIIFPDGSSDGRMPLIATWPETFLRDTDDPRKRQPWIALRNILANPRRAKRIVQQTRDAWAQLPGECLFEELLAFNAIQVAAPDVIGFINENIGFLKAERMHGHAMPDDEKLKPKQLYFKEWWERFLSNTNATTLGHANDIEALVSWLFPVWNVTNDRGYSILQPQRVAMIQHDDYWRRINLGRLHPERPKDQQVLHAIKNWKSKGGSNQEIYTEIARSAEFASVFKTFAGSVGEYKSTTLNRSDLAVLLKEVAIRVAIEIPVEVSITSSLWSVIQACENRDVRMSASDIELITNHVYSNNLAMGGNVFDEIWKMLEFETAEQLEKSREALRLKMCQNMAASVERDFIKFVKSINPNSLYTVWGAMLGFSGESGNINLPLLGERFSSMLALMVYNARFAPRVVVPQLAAIFFHKPDHERDPRLYGGPIGWNQNSLEDLLPIHKDQEQLMKLMADFDVENYTMPPVEPHVRAPLQTDEDMRDAVEAAKVWLKLHGANNA